MSVSRRGIIAVLAAAAARARNSVPAQDKPVIAIDSQMCACGYGMWRQRLNKDRAAEPGNLGITCSNQQCENFGKVFAMPMIALRQLHGVKPNFD